MFSTEGKLEAYVRRLHSQLDTTTVMATLTLMMGEACAASEKQRRLIALERLTRRNSAVSLNELQALEQVRTNLSTVLLRESGVAHGGMDDDWGTVVPLCIRSSNALRCWAMPPVAARPVSSIGAKSAGRGSHR